MFATQIERSRRPDGTLDEDRLVALINDAVAGTMAPLREEAARFKTVLDNFPHGVSCFDGARRLIASNDRYAEIYGLRPEDVRPGVGLAEILDLAASSVGGLRTDTTEYMALRERLTSTKGYTEILMELRDGKVIAVRHKPMADGGWVSTHEDVTDSHRAERQAIHMQTFDNITGLPNDVMLNKLLHQTMANCSAIAPCALLAIDLDGLRRINGAHGRTTGNQLIRQVADRMRLHLPKGGTLTRPGGGEFTIVLTGAAQPAAAISLAAELLGAMSEPFTISGHPIVIGASIGIAIADDPVPDAEIFLRNAATAVQRAKADGVGSFRVFTAEMDEAARARRQLEQDLRDAVATMCFELHYQPQVNLRTRRVTGFEALLRWRHPVRGNVPPSDFIPLAEELGLISAIGLWVLSEACREAARWPDEVGVAVNVSPLQFNDPHFVNYVAAALRDTGLPPARLELEITETIMMDRNSSTLDALHELRASGIRIAIDDFGIGYSSLSYLPSFPFDKIKIDRSFVSGGGRPRDRSAIVHAIIGLCLSLGMNCTAEGVETDAELLALVQEQCPEAQGYLFSRPIPSREIDAILARMNTQLTHAAPDRDARALSPTSVPMV